MFRFLKEKGGYGSQPPTPKIQSRSLPEDMGTPMRVDSPLRTPTPSIATHRTRTPSINIASPRPVAVIPRLGSQSPRPGTPVVRSATPAPQSTTPGLKPCLRQRTSTLSGVLSAEEARLAASKLRDEYIPPRNITIPTTRERKFSTTGGRSPETGPKKVSSSPVNSTIVPMKPPQLAVKLHWQLLSCAPDASNRRLRFNIAQPVSSMRCDPKNLEKLAARLEDEFADMTIKGDFLSKAIRIRRRNGIRCRDVFDAIHDAYSQVLSEREMEKIPEDDRTEVDAAFEIRCAQAPGLTAVEKRAGLRRVDLLKGRTLFSGLWEQENGTWLLHLGKP